MAAYAALVSVMNLIDRLEHIPRPTILLDDKLVQSLTNIVTFLQEFLQGYNSHLEEAADPLESRITNAAYAAEEIIELYIMSVGTITHGEAIRSLEKEIKKNSAKEREENDSGEESEGNDSGEVSKEIDSGEEGEENDSGEVNEEINSGEEGEENDSGEVSEEINSGEEGEENDSGEESEENDSREVGKEIDSGEESEENGSGEESEEASACDKNDYGEETSSSEEIVGEESKGISSGERKSFNEKLHQVIEEMELIKMEVMGIIEEKRGVQNQSKVDYGQNTIMVGLTIKNCHVIPIVISLDKQVKSLTEFDTFLQEFLGDHDSHAEDQMDTIKKEVMETAESFSTRTTPAAPLTSHATCPNKMVGFGDLVRDILDKLTGRKDDHQIIPIVGMGGSGKTSLARNIYTNPIVKEHFDICAWTTISQQCDAHIILREVLGPKNKPRRDASVDELGETLYKYLFGRRYLIIMDDMWSIDVWDKIKHFFRIDSNGSRIIITTRLLNLAFAVAGSPGIAMSFLDEDSSWSLFSETVFGENACPLQLEKLGKEIVRNCRGLPLSIVVIGGLLAKSENTRKYWKRVGKNLSSIVNFENDGHSMKILRMSYRQLPVYLKPCFLYMGVFEEDSKICVSRLVKLWICEGLLKPMSGKSLEETAKEYLKELVDRNLVLIDVLGATGNIKYCKIHDLLRDFCLREAEKERFYSVLRERNPKAMTSHGRIVIAMLDESHFISFPPIREKSHITVLMRRVFNAYDDRYEFFSYGYKQCYHLQDMSVYVNSRYLAFKAYDTSKFPSSICYLWNLQTLTVGNNLTLTAPVEFWKMPQLRHVEFHGGLYLPDPPNRSCDDCVLENLQSLKEVKNFKCGEEIIERIPNLKKLAISYDYTARSSDYYCLSNLECGLKKLESFSFHSPTFIGFEEELTFPQSLKKLRLSVLECRLGDMLLAKIGSLPHLEKLQLSHVSFKGGKWETVEGQFCSLKYLALEACEVECWTTESFHFPRLEHLHLFMLDQLEEIPSEIGEIPTLKSITLELCTESIVRSTKKMVEEVEELQGQQLSLVVRDGIKEDSQALQTLERSYFQLRY